MYEAELRPIAQTIWRVVLGLELEPAAAAPDPAVPRLVGCVDIDGAWEGTVAVECPAALARRIASAMYEIADADLARAEVADVVGELANMTGGNFKSLLPEPCRLAVPRVVDGDAAACANGRPIASELRLACEGELVRIVVFHDGTGGTA